MSKIQKITTGIVMAGMLLGVLAVVVPSYAAPIPTGKLGGSELGLSYGADTGLASTDVRTTVSRIIRVAMGLLGIVAVGIILIGGFKWMTAGGNDDQVGEAKKWIFSGVIGLAIILSAYALASFIISQLYTATTGESFTM
jgi:TRAP-type C4-dicarboxylate transport system permease small subunit